MVKHFLRKVVGWLTVDFKRRSKLSVLKLGLFYVYIGMVAMTLWEYFPNPLSLTHFELQIHLVALLCVGFIPWVWILWLDEKEKVGQKR